MTDELQKALELYRIVKAGYDRRVADGDRWCNMCGCWHSPSVQFCMGAFDQPPVYHPVDALKHIYGALDELERLVSDE